MYGNTKNNTKGLFLLQSLEDFNASRVNVKDWEISGVYGAETGNDFSTNLYFLSIAKRIGRHLIYLRYSPGLISSFRYNTGIVFISPEDSLQNLPQKRLEYKELFGLGYGISFSDKLSAGLRLKYFKQQFSVDYIKLNETEDGSYFSTIDSTETLNQWITDIGVNYQPVEDLKISLWTDNLFKINQNSEITDDNEGYKLKRRLTGNLGADYAVSDQFYLNAIYNTRNSFLAGCSYNLPVSDNNLTFGLSAFHYKERKPFIAGLYPSVSFSTDLFNISIGGIKYLRGSEFDNSIERLESEGIDNILSNYYSDDKLFASVNIALSFKNEQKVKILDLELSDKIYPVFNDFYLTTPIAKAKVTNISDERITVKPYSFNADLNNEKIQSPVKEINPGDTAEVLFYTLIDNDKDYKTSKITEMKFEVLTLEGEPDDEQSRPALLLDKNGWDGDVGKLKYFVRSGINGSAILARRILNSRKSELDTIASELKTFYKIKLIYDEIVKGLQYVSDPRSSSERVQMPVETLKLKGGDCDDLSVCFSSLMEGIGIQTAFVDYRSDEGINHVNLLINTGIPPGYLESITRNDKKVFIRKNSAGIEEIWLPLETTVLTDFDEAWSTGSGRFYREVVQGLGLMKNKVEIFDLD